MAWSNLKEEIAEEFGEFAPTQTPERIEAAYKCQRDFRYRNSIGARWRMEHAYKPELKRRALWYKRPWCGCVTPKPDGCRQTTFARCSVCGCSIWKLSARRVWVIRHKPNKPTEHFSRCTCFECVMRRLTEVSEGVDNP